MKIHNLIRQRLLNPISALSIFAASLIVLSNSAQAASSFSDHLWKFANASGTNMIDFNKGKSKIYDNGNLHIVTDDFIYLNAPDTVFTQKDLSVGGTLDLYRNGTNKGGSKIYENNDLHIATDDHLYLDAPSDVNVQNDLNVVGNSTTNGDVTSTGGVFTGDGSGLTNLTVDSSTVSGVILTAPTVSFNGDVTANSLTSNNDLIVNGTTSIIDLVVNGNTTQYGTLQVEDGATFDANITVNGSTTLNSSVTGTGDSDYSGASSFRLPVVSTALSDGVTTCTSTGSVVFTTNDHRLYICDGTHWLMILKGGD